MEEFTKYLKNFEELNLDGSESSIKDVVQCLINFEEACSKKGGFNVRGVKSYLILNYYTRIAAILERGLMNVGKIPLSRETLERLCYVKHVINSIFSASGYEGSAYLIAKHSSDETGKISFQKNMVLYYLILCGLDDCPHQLLVYAKSQFSAEIFGLLVLGFLQQRAVTTSNGEKNRQFLLKNHATVGEVRASNHNQIMLAKVYFNASYFDCDERHEIKITINKKFQITHQNIFPNFTFNQKTANRKKRILILAETFASSHAMYRCFAAQIRDLKATFEVGIVADENSIDKKALELFDHVYTGNLKSVHNFEDAISFIRDFQPDVIYYPSIGMALWTIIFSNFRLAQKQIMGMGHPGPSKSSVIDYAAVSDASQSFSKFHDEELLVLDTDDTEMVDHPEMDSFKKPEKLVSSSIKIAINAKVLKLSPRFLNALERVKNESDVEIVYYFFPNDKSTSADGSIKALLRKFPDARVFSSSNYSTYLNNLSECHISAAPFPFGNTNGAVDTVYLGIPNVALNGTHVSDRTDMLVNQLYKQPANLITDSEDQYVEQLLLLANNQNLLHKISADVTEGLEKHKVELSNRTKTRVNGIIRHIIDLCDG